MKTYDGLICDGHGDPHDGGWLEPVCFVVLVKAIVLHEIGGHLKFHSGRFRTTIGQNDILNLSAVR